MIAVNARARIAAIAAVVVLLVGIPAAVTASYVDREWALYTAPSAGAAYELFLDPFPDEQSCEADAAIVRRNGGFAQCHDRYVLAFDRSVRDRLAWEFLSPENPFARICRPARHRR